jgi:hypothetical protein
LLLLINYKVIIMNNILHRKHACSSCNHSRCRLNNSGLFSLHATTSSMKAIDWVKISIFHFLFVYEISFSDVSTFLIIIAFETIKTNTLGSRNRFWFLWGFRGTYLGIFRIWDLLNILLDLLENGSTWAIWIKILQIR